MTIEKQQISKPLLTNVVAPQDPHLIELATAALKARDLANHKTALAQSEKQQVSLELDRMKIQLDARDARIAQLERELEDEKSNNQMLQRMMKRLAKDR